MKKLLLLILLVLILLLVLFFFGGHSGHEHESGSHGNNHSNGHTERHGENMSHQHESPAQQEEDAQSKLHANHQMGEAITRPIAGAAKQVEAKLKAIVRSETGLSDATLSVSNGWVRQIIPGSDVTAAYLDISSSNPLSLSKFSSPDFERVEIHDMKLSESGVMTMVKLDSLRIDESGTLLSPNGKHIMLINPTRNIKVGETVEVTLEDKRRLGGTITINLPVVSGN